MRNAQLLCWILFGAGALTSVFGIIWSFSLHNDPSQFLLSLALGITMMAVAQVGSVVLKQGLMIEDINKKLKQQKDEAFEFEGWVRDKLK